MESNNRGLEPVMLSDSKKIGISVIIATKNEERNIQKAISSVQNFSEVLVVDSSSTDQTVNFAIASGAKVHNFLWDGQYPKKRQWILDNIPTSNDWIFFLDADEQMTKSLERELQDFLLNEKNGEYSAGLVVLSAFLNGIELKFGYKTKGLRLLNRKEVEFPFVDDLNAPGMGEIEGHYQPLCMKKIFKLKGTLNHDDSDSLSDWYLRHIRYAEWDAWIRHHPEARKAVYSNKYGVAWIFHKMPMKPVIFFIYSYFLRLGFLDGRRGLTFALNYAWFYWLTDNLDRYR